MKIFLDTSVYISHYRRGSYSLLLHQLNAEHLLYLHAVVLAELYAGAKTRAFLKELTRLEKLFAARDRMLVPQKRDYLSAGKILRKQGAAMLADALIAASARHEGFMLVSEDGDFERIKNILPFRLLIVKEEISK